MARRLLILLLIVPFLAPSVPAESLSYYLPEGVLYDAETPRPSQTFGWEVGEWHVRHDQLVRYFEVLAEQSERVELKGIGTTHEQRPLVQALISSPRNLARLDEILEGHAQLADPSTPRPDTTDLPVIVNLGYSIHGNEASGSNAAPVVAYHLAAARGQAHEDFLDKVLVVLDPCLNPDGLARFALHANSHRGQVLVGDPQHREHQEGWPSGRTNHYWFDLNRDWLLAQHPESQARLESFHRIRPNVLADFHEMGSNSTYFFQPGVPSRQNPHTPARNLELTHAFAQHHARALEALGSHFFTEELFDDFYYGKGSTYPDLQGSVGILFEQASSRGHLQDTSNGALSFPFTIRNQVHTSFSTLAGALENREALLDYRAEFFEGSMELAAADTVSARVFGDTEDPVRGHLLAQLLRRHGIEVHALAQPFEQKGMAFEPGSAFVVPSAQAQYRLVNSIFERPTEFTDSTFYDVSTWNLALSFNLPMAELSRGADVGSLLGARVEGGTLPSRDLELGETPHAYLLDWRDFFAPRALDRLMRKGVVARVAMQPFLAITRGGGLDFPRGTVVIPMGLQRLPATEVAQLLRSVARREGVRVHATDSGLTPEGIDLGSPSLRPLKAARPALVVGPGVSAYEAGEIWHLLDHRFEMPLSLVRSENFGRVDLDRYSHLILVNGRYGDWRTREIERLDAWVKAGGVLITTQQAAAWATEHLLTASEEKEAKPAASTPELVRRPFGDRSKDRGAQVIGGTFFEVELDLTHPIAYGYTEVKLPVFRHHRVVLAPENDPYVVVGAYSLDPLLCGYVSQENLEKISDTPAVLADVKGRGAVIRLVDDPNFRSVLYGTNRLLLNSLFFGDLLGGR